MTLLLLIVAIICFVLRAFSVLDDAKVDIGWIGLAFFAGAFIPNLT